VLLAWKQFCLNSKSLDYSKFLKAIALQTIEISNFISKFQNKPSIFSRRLLEY
jgi:hypothetical protein